MPPFLLQIGAVVARLAHTQEVGACNSTICDQNYISGVGVLAVTATKNSAFGSFVYSFSTLTPDLITAQGE